MEIGSARVVSMMFSAMQLWIMVVVVHPTVASHSLTLGINECFERVSIGKRLNGSDVTRSVGNTTLKQCDVECERETCDAFAFGIGPNGNGTCDISGPLPRSPPNDDPDFDLFIRVLQCRNSTMCFRRLVSGRKLIDRYIRRTFPCDSLVRCQLACSLEREFICEGFNYRFSSSPDIGNSCQLTAMPGFNLDLTLDFVSDRDYDFYDRDRNAPAACGHLTYRTWNYGHSKQNDWQKPADWREEPRPRPRFGDKSTAGGSNECFVRARTGFRIDRRVIVLTLNAPTLYDCEFVCANERKFLCNIISYRYSSLPSTDNCQLGEKTIRQLDFYFDLVPDRDYDVYVRNEYSRPGCQPTRTWNSDCFERIRTGLRLERTMVRFAVNTDTLIDCELICLHIRHFTCRAFSYRYGTSRSEYNCLLTDLPIPEMDPRKHFVEDMECELYHRGSYGHGCEIDQWPYSARPQTVPNFVPAEKNWPAPYLPPHPTVTVTTTTTFRPQYDPFIPPSPSSTPGSDFLGGNMPSSSSGGRPYLPPENPYPSFPSPGYKHRVPYKPPQKPHVTWSTPNDFDKPGIKKLDKICYISYGLPARLTPTAVGNAVLVVNEQECKAECSRARDSSNFRCSTLSYWSGHCELSDIELRDLKPVRDFVQHDTYWLFSWDYTNPKCYSTTSTSVGEGIWSTFTVSGRRCKWGTICSFSPEAGIWSCPVDNGDWDYCCRPDHRCGYSEGYNYPWCYVGTFSREQWRPCSESYYPYPDHNRRGIHWPISYLHKNGPPNMTSRHQPSIVDSFLESLQFNKERNSRQNNETAPTAGSSHPYMNNSSMIEFQIVDVTENPRGNLTDNSTAPWQWNQIKSSNITTLSNHYNSINRILPFENMKMKRESKKSSPNIT